MPKTVIWRTPVSEVLIWKVIPLCVMWAIWRDHNPRMFEGLEHPNHVIKKSVLRCLHKWITAPGCIPCHFLEFIDSLNLSL